MEKPTSWLNVFMAFLRLGLTSFGGPIAHLGYFRQEFVERRKWLSEHAYADLVALCQFLPGPASSQVGIAIGLSRAGIPGALAAWLAFTLPSAILLVLFAYGLEAFGISGDNGWLHGLKVAAVAVVAQAVWSMARTLAPDRQRASLAVAAAAIALLVPTTLGQIASIVLGGAVGYLMFSKEEHSLYAGVRVPVNRWLAMLSLFLFFGLLIGLPLLTSMEPDHSLALFDSFYRAGALVFGGGHVVLPLLQASVVPTGWVTNDAFLAGYGATQAVPGPMFAFAAYLGAVMGPEPNGWAGAAICLAAIFLPSFLLIVGALPFWEMLRGRDAMQASLRGVNAAVIGILMAALYDPVWVAGIKSPADFALGVTAFLLLTSWKTPSWLVVIITALGSLLIRGLGA